MDAAVVTVIGAGCGVVTSACLFAGFWLAQGSRQGAVETVAQNAIQTAAEAAEAVKQSEGRITALASQFALYRENSVEKFVTHQAITELEKRLVESQAKSEERWIDALDGLNRRLDRLIEAGLGKRA